MSRGTPTLATAVVYPGDLAVAVGFAISDGHEDGLHQGLSPPDHPGEALLTGWADVRISSTGEIPPWSPSWIGREVEIDGSWYPDHIVGRRARLLPGPDGRQEPTGPARSRPASNQLRAKDARVVALEKPLWDEGLVQWLTTERRPTEEQPVVVAVSIRPEAARRALMEIHGGHRLVEVHRARWPERHLREITAALTRHEDVLAAVGTGLGTDRQVRVAASVTRMTEELARDLDLVLADGPADALQLQTLTRRRAEPRWLCSGSAGSRG